MLHLQDSKDNYCYPTTVSHFSFIKLQCIASYFL